VKFAIITLIGLIAAVDMVSPDIVSSLVEAGSTVVLGGILAWLVLRRMPARDREHDAAMEKKDELFSAAVKEVADRQHDDSIELNKTMTNLQVALAKTNNT